MHCHALLGVSIESMSIILQFYPNGEFTQGVDTCSHKKSRPERISANMCNADISPVGMSAMIAEMNASMQQTAVQPGQEFISAMHCRYTYLCNAEGEYHFAVEESDGYTYQTSTTELPERFLYLRGATPSLGLSDGRILTKTSESRKKCLAMTKSMARNIRNAGYVLQQKYGKDCLSFLTLTMPNLSHRDAVAVCENWDKITHKFFKWLRTRVEKQNIPLEYVYCTEIQTKRLQQRKEYAPHLHIIFRGKNGKRRPWAVTPKQVRKEWVRCIRFVSCDTFDSSACENLQVVKRSASGYLAKYMSKGANHIPQDNEKCPTVQLRTHWGGMSRNLARAIARARVVIRGDGDSGVSARRVLGSIPRGVETGLVKYFKRGEIHVSGVPDDISARYIKVGTGCLSSPTWEGGLIPLINLSNTPEFDLNY